MMFLLELFYTSDFCFCLFFFLFVFSNRCLAGLLKGDPLYRHKTLCSHSLTTV